MWGMVFGRLFLLLMKELIDLLKSLIEVFPLVLDLQDLVKLEGKFIQGMDDLL